MTTRRSPTCEVKGTKTSIMPWTRDDRWRASISSRSPCGHKSGSVRASRICGPWVINYEPLSDSGGTGHRTPMSY